jgi:hypothetical protein
LSSIKFQEHDENVENMKMPETCRVL